MHSLCGCGEIGRRTRLRIWRREACRFDPYHPHKALEEIRGLFYFIEIPFALLLYFSKLAITNLLLFMLFPTKKHVDISGIIPSVSARELVNLWTTQLPLTNHENAHQHTHPCKANVSYPFANYQKRDTLCTLFMQRERTPKSL